MVLAWCRVGVDATSRNRTDVYMAIFRCWDVESTSIRRIDVDATPFWHCVPGECIVNVVVSVKVWTSSFLVYSIMRCRIVRERILYTWFTWLFFVMSFFPSFASCISFRQERTMRGSQWLIKIYILYVMEIKIIQKIIFRLTIKCKC